MRNMSARGNHYIAILIHLDVAGGTMFCVPVVVHIMYQTAVSSTARRVGSHAPHHPPGPSLGQASLSL